MARLKDIPKLERDGSNLSAFAEAVREVLQTFRGYRGDKLDKALTVRDFKEGTLTGLGGTTTVIGGGTGGGGSPTIDPTPPPSPPSLSVTAGISHIYFSHPAPTYTQGHGHDRTVVYGAKWPDGDPPPVFADAVELCTFQGTVGSYPSDPNTRWCIWIKWRTMDQFESASPTGGTNGVQATTGQDVTTLLQALNEAAADGSLPYSRVSFRADQFYIQPDCDFNQEATPTGTSAGQLWYKPSTEETKRWDGAAWQSFSTPLPFLVQTAPTTINGVTIPAGVYMDSAFIYDLTASIARLGTAWIDNAMVADMSVGKLTAGALQVGSYVRSTTYTPGVAGWTINADGTAEFAAASIRGQLLASQIDTRGLTIKDAAGNVLFSSGMRDQSPENLCSNPSGDVNTDGWSTGVSRVVHAFFGDGTRPSLYHQFRDVTFGNAVRTNPGDAYYVSFETLPQGGTVQASGWQIEMGAVVYDAAGSVLSVHLPAVRMPAVSGPAVSSGEFVVPAGGYSLQVYGFIRSGGPPGDLGGANGVLFRNVIVRKQITATNGATYIKSLNADRITAGTITTDRLVANAVTAANNGSWAVAGGTLGGVSYSSGVVGTFSLTTTGSRVKVMGGINVNGILSGATAVYLSIHTTVYIDGVPQTPHFGGLRPLRPVAGPGMFYDDTQTVFWDGTLSAGAHTFGIQVFMNWYDAAGNPFVLGFGTLLAYGQIMAEENKV